MQHRAGHVGNGYNFPLFTDKELCDQANAECGKLSMGADSNIDCGPCSPGKMCVGNKCQGGDPIVNLKDQYCTTPGFECGVVKVPNQIGGSTDVPCGDCPTNKVCVANMCRSQFAAAIASQMVGVVQSGSMPTPKPLPGKFDVKAPIYEGQPYLKALLQTIYNQLSSVSSIPAEGKTQEMIKAWMDEKGFTTIVEACNWAGYGPDLVGVDNYCKDVGKMGLNPVTQAMCDKRKKELLNNVAKKCSSTYTSDYLATVEALKQQELDRLQQEKEQQEKEAAEQQAGEQIPVPEKSNALLWVLGIGVVAAAGAAVYFSQKTAGSNPSERTSGYKKLEPALVQALKLARKDREEKYVLPRSDGLHILRHQSLPFDKKTGMMKDRESWVVLPNNNYIHWFDGDVADSGPIE